MKRLLLLFISFAVMSYAVAADYRFTINNINDVVFDVADVQVNPVADGDLYKVDMGSERYLRVIANPCILFASVSKEDTYYGETQDLTHTVMTLDDGRYYVDLYSSFPEDEIFHIVTSGASEARSATCVINIDEPSRVKVTRGGEVVELVAGNNDVKFNAANEATIEIEPVGKPLYKVLHGEKEVTADYRYQITVADGDVISVTANYPDEDCPVMFLVEGYGAEDFITGVDVDGKPVFNWTAEDFSVKCGSELTVYGNLNEYEVLSFMVNGESQIFTSKTTLLIVENTAIAANVQKYAVFPITITIDDPANVHVYRGHSQNDDEFTNLHPGANVVEITRNTPIVSIVPVDNYYVSTLSVNEEEYDVEDLQIVPIRIGQLMDNDRIELTTAQFMRDKKATVILKNVDLAEGYFRATRADRSEIENLHEGENELLFDPRDNDFRFETGGPVTAYVRHNGELMEPEPGGFTYCPTLADGDMLTISFGEDWQSSIHEVTVHDNLKNRIFDLQGRQVANPSRGILISVSGTKQVFK